MVNRKRRGRRGRGGRGPAKSSKRQGFRVPWIPVGIAGGIAAVIILVLFLVVQANQTGSDSQSEWVEMEADPAPDLPGEFVDLQEIYGGTYGAHGDNATARHLTRDIDYEADGNTTPPAGGPHWGSGACPDDPSAAPVFCGPAPWGIYREPWEPEVLVHNTEHGGVVLWYNTTNQEIIGEMEELIRNRLEDGDILVMAPYPDMEEEYIALTSWARIDKFPVTEYSKPRVEDFINVHLRRFNPEDF